MTLEEQIQKLTAERDALKQKLVDVEGLNEEWNKELVDKLTRERDAALKACAEMRDVLKEVEWRGSGDLELMRDNFFCPICHAHGADCERLPHDPECQLQHALSTDCGKGYHHDDEWRPVVEALKMASELSTGQDCDPRHHDVVVAAMNALEHSEKLMSK